MAKIALVSLGCPKNLVDSECMAAHIVRGGHKLVVDETCADVIVVNTCGFIESARAESAEAIQEALDLKRAGKCRAVVVVGCLSQRFGSEMVDQLPEIDVVLGIEHPRRIGEAISRALRGEKLVDAAAACATWTEPAGRIRSTPAWTAYLKISDGCDNRCSYCVIPDIRGPFRSRPERFIIEEAKRLAGEGARELILVGQDVTQYGADVGQPNLLPGLLEKLNGVDGLKWIRLMYCYPTKVTRELIDAAAGLDRVVKYMDLPLQHGDPGILRAMNRRGTPDEYLRVIDELRSRCPDIALRTSLIVGFPGETEAAFERLVEFAERISFDRVGAFAYSREEGTPAARMKNQVGRRTAEARLDALMRLQQRISLERNKRFVGRKMEVLVEGPDWGRSYRDAPEIDGIIRIGRGGVRPGEFVTVKITGADVYDLEGERI